MNITLRNNNYIVNILTADQAKKLADLYLPTHLRDFFLGMDPVLQCHFYTMSKEPTHFFTLILTEWSRYDNEYARTQQRKRVGFDSKIVPVEKVIEYDRLRIETTKDSGDKSNL